MSFSFDKLAIAVILLWVFLYTVSFGVWTWKAKNKLGAVMVFWVAIAVIALPVYSIFFVR
jgi:hypothetical protein